MSNTTTTTTTPAPAEIKADMQDVLYGAMYERYCTSEEALDALMPHVDRYVAAELRRLADDLTPESGEDGTDWARAMRGAMLVLRSRAAELDSGTDTTMED